MDSAAQILSNGFRPVQDLEAWLGPGVYFFIDGIIDGRTMAKDWAKFRKPDVDTCVIKCHIECPASKVLDLRNEKNLKVYNNARMEFVEKGYDKLMMRRDLKLKKRRDIRLDDAIVSKEVMKTLGKTVMIHNLYVKTDILRRLEMESCYPTVVGLCVGDVSYIKKSLALRG